MQAECGIMGGSAASTSSHLRAPARTRSSPARTATTRPTSRSRVAIPRAAEFPRGARRARGGRDARRDDDRGAGRVPRRSTPRATVEGDARRRRTTARSCSRSCAATTGSSEVKLLEALGERVPSRDRGRDPRRLRRRAAARSARSASTVEVVADEALREGSSSPARTATGCHLRGVAGGPRLRAPLRRHPRAARGRHVPEVRRAAPLPDGDRGRAHLQARDATTRSRSSATFLDEDGNEKPLRRWAATGSARRA